MAPNGTAEYDWLLLVRRQYRRVLVGAVVGLAAGSAYAFLAPKWYQAEIAVVPGGAPKSAAAGLAGALAGELPVELNLGGSSSDAERILAVLKSRSVVDAVIEKFGLVRRYEESDVEGARRALWTHCFTRLDKKPSVVTLACEDKDPKIAVAMAAYFGEVGNDVFRRISASSAGEERRFLERRVDETRKAVDDTANRLREFEEKHKLIDLGEQSKAVVSAIASLNSDLMSKELELSYVHGFSSSDEATTQQLRRQVSVLESKLRDLEQPKPDTGPATSGRTTDDAMFPPALRVPKLRFELEQLYREKKIQEALFLLLTQRYEMAKVNEARDTSAFQILDAPRLPTRKSRPKRAEVIATSLVLGAALGLLWIVVDTRYRRTIT